MGSNRKVQTKLHKKGLVAQINLLVLVGIVILAIITYVSQYHFARVYIMDETGKLAEEAAEDLISAIKEYPAYRWLLEYWYHHADQLDIEYDVDFGSGTLTEEKSRLLVERHPDLQLHYCTEEEVQSLPEEDQKLYAEIIYTWMTTRINASKHNLRSDYLFCIVTGTDASEHPYETQYFLLSGAEPDAVRGTEYEQVYTLGVEVPVMDMKNTRESMRNAVKRYLNPSLADPKTPPGEKLEDAGNYVDYYTCMEVIGDHAFIAGATYNLRDMLSEIHVQTWRGTLLAALYQYLLIAIILVHILLYVLNPLKKVLQNIKLYSKTKDSKAIEKNLTEVLSGRHARAINQNEIGQLAEDFIGLTKEVDDYIDQIEKAALEKKRYKEELNVAAGIQAHMLPSSSSAFLERCEFDLSAYMAPAREVGGDFYDYFLIDENHLALVIADVSDKGIPAALFMVVAKTLIKNLAQMGRSPGKVLYDVNNILNEGNESGYFVTVWFAVIDLTSGEGTAVNAGHEHPAICRAGGSYELDIYKHSPMIGVIEDIEYKEHTFRLNPGDRLFVYTDGLPEAANLGMEQFGLKGMLGALNRNKDATPDELLRQLKVEMDLFAGEAPQFDDTTMMCLYYYGPEGK